MMNELFVNVKVDREERPDIDQIYQVGAADAHAAHRRLAAHDVPHARPGPVLRRHLLPEGRRATACPGFVDLHAARAGLLRRAARRDRDAERRARRGPRAHAAARRGARLASSPTPRSRGDRLPRRRFDASTAASAGAPKFPHPDSIELLPAPPRRDRRRGLARHGHDHARADGRGRHLRPARRRLRALQRRRRMGHPALREDALRQRPAPAPVRRRVGHHGRSALRARRRGDGRLGDARDAVARGRLLLLARRRLRGRGRQVLRLDARRGARAPHRRTSSRSSRSRTTASTGRPTSRATRGTRWSRRRSRTSPPSWASRRPTRPRARLGAREAPRRPRAGASARAATTRSSPRGTRS